MIAEQQKFSISIKFPKRFIDGLVAMQFSSFLASHHVRCNLILGLSFFLRLFFVCFLIRIFVSFACKLAKPSACIAKCMTTINKI